MKYLIVSIILCICTRIHVLLNKPPTSTEIMMSDIEGRNFVDFLPYTRIIQNTSHNLFTFLSRESNHINTLITKSFPSICFSKKKFEYLYEQYTKENWKPILRSCKKLIVVDEYSLPNALLVKYANTAGIHTIGVQHGSISPTHQGYARINNLPKNEVVKTFLCYSEYEKRIISKSAIENIVVTGSPRHDHLLINQSEKNKRIIWFSQAHNTLMRNSGENLADLMCVYHWLKQNKDWNLYVKLHPNESYVFNMYHIYKIMFPGRCTITKQRDYADVLSNSAISITKNSTCGYDSIIAGVPCIILSLKETLAIDNYTDLPYPYIAYNEQDFTKLMEDMNYDEFLSVRHGFMEERFPHHKESKMYMIKQIENL